MPRSKQPKRIYRFLVTLQGIKPPIWRRIELSEASTFWELHMAIQDAFGWRNAHLHEFLCPKSGLTIGIALDDGFVDPEDLPLEGWKEHLDTCSLEVGDTLRYLYDFGDYWEHELVLEGILLRPLKIKFPRCLDGERACPPEDSGGVSGYAHLLRALSDPNHDEHLEYVAWLKGQYRKKAFDPNFFDPHSVTFKNPQKQLELWLED